MSGSPLQSSIANVAADEPALGTAIAEVQTAAAGVAAGTITPAALEKRGRRPGDRARRGPGASERADGGGRAGSEFGRSVAKR